MHISSGLAHTSTPAMAAYGVSKAALLMMKDYFNTECNEQDIRFASAMPGVVDTPIQTYLRSCDSTQFPAVESFHGFFKRGELLQPKTAAKFLSWLLLNVDDDKFTQSDWNIYDVSHHKYWAHPNEVKPRQKTHQELAKENNQPTNYSFYLLCTAGLIAIIASARFIFHGVNAENTCAISPL